MKVNITLDTRKNGETPEGFPIVVVVRDNYKQKILRLGYYSKPGNWNKSMGAPKSNHPKFYELNDFLLRIKSRISSLLSERMESGLTIVNFKDRLFARNSPIFNESATELLPKGYTGTKLSALNSFDSYFPKARFKEISFDMVEEYISKLKKKGNSPGGIDSYIRSLRALWNRLSDDPNPFKGHRIVIPPKVKRVSTAKDMRKFARAKLSDKGEIGSFSKCRHYWMLMFYFGGIDPEVLAKLRYDQHFQNNRLVFNRDKGGSSMLCNNTVPPQALAILKKFDCKPYLVPIHKTGNPESFIRNFRRALKKISEELQLGAVMHPKSARYTFIDRAQQLLVDERITAQIVGHKRKTTTSLYTNDFPLEVQDEAHLKIVDLGKSKKKNDNQKGKD
jgi:integrase